MHYRLWVILPLAILIGAAHAGVIRSVQIHSVGVGHTMQQAISNGLVNAIQQVDGVTISKQTAFASLQVSVQYRDNRQYLNSHVYLQRIQEASRGTIVRFAVEHSVCITEGAWAAIINRFKHWLGKKPTRGGCTWTVRLVVTVAKYMHTAAEDRVRIAVLVPRVSASAYSIFGTTVSGQIVANRLADRIQNYLVDTHKLTVLDRKYGPEVQSELAIAASGAAPTKEYALIGQKLVADYVLVGTIYAMHYRLIHRRSLTGSHVYTSVAGGITFSYRLINTATQQVVLSAVRKVGLHKFLSMQGSLSPSSVLSHDLNRLGPEVGQSVLSKIYPIRVASVLNNEYVIDAGAGVVKAGQVYQVIGYGRKIIDPDTHESLGRTQTVCCWIRINRVTRRLAYAILLPPTRTLTDFTPTAYVLGSLVVVHPQHAHAVTTKQAMNSVMSEIKRQKRSNAKHGGN